MMMLPYYNGLPFGFAEIAATDGGPHAQHHAAMTAAAASAAGLRGGHGVLSQAGMYGVTGYGPTALVASYHTQCSGKTDRLFLESLVNSFLHC